MFRWTTEKIKESKKDKQIPGLCHRTKRNVEHVGDGGANCNWCAWDSLRRLGKGTGRIGNQRKNREHPDPNIVKIS